MTPRYIAFILTKNWFGQTWAGIGYWYYMGCWLNVWNFRKKKFFFQNFNTFFCFENDLSVIFGFLIPKLMKVPIFIKIQWTYHQLPRWPPRGRKRRIVVQTFNCNISETIWDRSLIFGTFTYLHSMYICSKFHWNLRRWVQTWPTLMWNFPVDLKCNITYQNIQEETKVRPIFIPWNA